LAKNVLVDNIGSYPTIFVMLPLPYQKIETNVFTRKYGNYELTFYSPYKSVPFGKFPRSLLSLITTQFVLQRKSISDDEKQRTIELDNIRRTARLLNITNYGSGKMQSLLYTAMDNLTDLNIHTRSIKVSSKYKIIKKANIPLFESSNILWPKMREKDIAPINQQDLFKSNLIISPQFRNIIIEHAVPIDIEVYNSFKTARLQDLYAWSVKRLKDVKKEEFVSWDVFLPQFFDKVGNKTEQRNYIIDDLEEIKKEYPEAKIETNKAGIILLPSRLHIEKKQLGYV